MARPVSVRNQPRRQSAAAFCSVPDVRASLSGPLRRECVGDRWPHL